MQSPCGFLPPQPERKVPSSDLGKKFSPVLTGGGCSQGIVTKLPVFGYLEGSPGDDGKQLSYIAGEGQSKGKERKP